MKTQEKLKELEILYQNPIYICISWCSKISNETSWFQQNLKHVSRDLCAFWIFFRQVITVTNSIIVGYMWQILGREHFCPPLSPSLGAALKRPIMNGVKKTELILTDMVKSLLLTKMSLSVGSCFFNIKSYTLTSFQIIILANLGKICAF